MNEIVYSAAERIDPAEYLAFLRRSDLGRLYPKADFDRRMPRLLEQAGVVVTARRQGELVGACLGVTDWTYFLFITDIGVARGHERRGIGRELLRRAQEVVGSLDEITVATWSNASAMPFYESCGLSPQAGLVGRGASGWESFDVTTT